MSGIFRVRREILFSLVFSLPQVEYHNLHGIIAKIAVTTIECMLSLVLLFTAHTENRKNTERILHFTHKELI